MAARELREQQQKLEKSDFSNVVQTSLNMIITGASCARVQTESPHPVAIQTQSRLWVRCAGARRSGRGPLARQPACLSRHPYNRNRHHNAKLVIGSMAHARHDTAGSLEPGRRGAVGRVIQPPRATCAMKPVTEYRVGVRFLACMRLRADPRTNTKKLQFRTVHEVRLQALANSNRAYERYVHPRRS